MSLGLCAALIDRLTVAGPITEPGAATFGYVAHAKATSAPSPLTP